MNEELSPEIRGKIEQAEKELNARFLNLGPETGVKIEIEGAPPQTAMFKLAEAKDGSLYYKFDRLVEWS